MCFVTLVSYIKSNSPFHSTLAHNFFLSILKRMALGGNVHSIAKKNNICKFCLIFSHLNLYNNLAKDLLFLQIISPFKAI